MACSGPCAMPIETLSLPAGSISVLARLSAIRRASPSASPASQEPMITPNSSPPSRQTTSDANDATEQVGQLDEHEVAAAVAVDVVHPFEVVDVEHEDGDRVVRTARAVQLGAEAVVE